MPPSRKNRKARTRVCFVTGTRAEFGLMQSALAAVRAHPELELQIIATGMHLDPAHGDPEAIKNNPEITRVVPWRPNSGLNPTTNAMNAGQAVADLAHAFVQLQPDVVLVVGDRVEAFAAASAAHLCHIPLAHIHGGDRARGQIDDSLRHAITKLAHVHFPATRASARRIRKLGEDAWRIHQAGSPGIDDIERTAAPPEDRFRNFPHAPLHHYALLVLHPTDADADAESERARLLLDSVRTSGVSHVVIIYPNNDPGAAGIIRTWRGLEKDPHLTVVRDVPRPIFLALLRDAAVLVGNSSSGIIEAASFDTPVLDVGPRQLGRERSKNVVHVELVPAQIRRELKRIWNDGNPERPRVKNVYGGRGAGEKIAAVLASLPPREQLLRKLITY